MSFFFLILLGLIIYLAWPFIRVMLAFRKATKQSREYFNSQRRSSAPRQPKTKPARKHKIIDPSVGEYVDFEEIRTYSSQSTSDGSTQVHYQEESQVTDVEWEDI